MDWFNKINQSTDEKGLIRLYALNKKVLIDRYKISLLI